MPNQISQAIKDYILKKRGLVSTPSTSYEDIDPHTGIPRENFDFTMDLTPSPRPNDSAPMPPSVGSVKNATLGGKSALDMQGDGLQVNQIPQLDSRYQDYLDAKKASDAQNPGPGPSFDVPPPLKDMYKYPKGLGNSPSGDVEPEPIDVGQYNSPKDPFPMGNSSTGTGLDKLMSQPDEQMGPSESLMGKPSEEAQQPEQPVDWAPSQEDASLPEKAPDEAETLTDEASQMARAPSGGDRLSYLIPNLGKAFSNVGRGGMKPVDTGLSNDMAKQIQFQQTLDNKGQDRQAKIAQYILQRRNMLKDQKDLALYKNGLPPKGQANVIGPLGPQDPVKSQNQQRGDIAAADRMMKHPVLLKESTKINAARGARSLLEAIKSNHLVPSKNISTQLTNLINSIEMGGPGAVADRKSAGVDTLYSKLQELVGHLTGSPTDVIPQAYLDQLNAEVNALGDRAAQNYSNQLKSSLQTAGSHPMADRMKSSGETFLKQNGYDPDGQKMKVKIKSPSGKVYEIDPARQDIIKEALENKGELL